jgi:hypothetical protein
MCNGTVLHCVVVHYQRSTTPLNLLKNRKKKSANKSSQTNQHLLTPKKLYHEYKLFICRIDVFFLFKNLLTVLLTQI